MITVDVFCPIGEPSNSLVVDNSLPFSWGIRFGDWGALANVNRDVLGAKSEL